MALWCRRFTTKSPYSLDTYPGSGPVYGWSNLEMGSNMWSEDPAVVSLCRTDWVPVEFADSASPGGDVPFDVILLFSA